MKCRGLSVTGTHVSRPTRANGWQPLAECSSLALSFFFSLFWGRKVHNQLLSYNTNSCGKVGKLSICCQCGHIHPLLPLCSSSNPPDVWSLSLTEVHTERREGLGFTSHCSEQPYIRNSCFGSLLYSLQCNLLFA